jgi:hypothetical protein
VEADDHRRSWKILQVLAGLFAPVTPRRLLNNADTIALYPLQTLGSGHLNAKI